MNTLNRFLVLVLGVMLCAGLAQAQITSAATGDWSNTATWVGGVVPGGADDVVIASGHNVTIDLVNAACNNLTISGNLYFSVTTSGMGITINGNATVNAGARFRMASSTPATPFIHQIDFKKNLTVVATGTFDMRQTSGANGAVGRVIFSGSSNSTISLALTTYTSSTEEFNSIEINKTGGAKVVLASGNLFQSNNSSNFPDSLVLTSGIIETGSNTWVMLRTGSDGIFGGSVTSYVNGILGHGVSNGGGTVKILFQVGDANGYRPVRLRFTAPSNATGHYVWVKTVAGDANTGSSTLNDGMAKVSAVRYQQIGYTKGLGSGVSMVVDSVELSYGTDDGVAAGNTALCVAYSTDARATWDSIGIATPHTTDLTTPPTFISPDAFATSITLADGASMYSALGTFNSTTNTLPVQLSSFTAAAGLRGTTLTWKTASEADNAGFEVERRAVDSRQSTVLSSYAKIGFVAGAGTSTSGREYSYTDAPAPGRYAYRLKQIDRDGASTYSGEVEVVVGLAPEVVTLGAYPNPFNPATVIDFTLQTDGQATLRVFNLLGQEVATLFAGQATAGRLYQVPFDASRLTSGIYVARLESGKSVAMTRLTVIK
jgi:hypothetical protein